MVHVGLTAMELCMLTDGSTRQGRLPCTANFYTNMQGYSFFAFFLMPRTFVYVAKHLSSVVRNTGYKLPIFALTVGFDDRTVSFTQ